MGVGSSRQCQGPFIDCDGNSYVFMAARTLRTQGFTVSVSPLGVPGAVISKGFLDLALQYGRNDVVLNMIQSEVPFIPKEATLITVFAGANDVNVITSALGLGAGGSNPAGFIDEKIAAFRDDYITLVAAIRAKARNARIVVFNLPNLGAMPYLASAPLLQKQAAQRASVGMTRTAINSLSDVAVIDLMCDSRFYQPGTLSTDGFHPSDAGYAIMAAELVEAATASSYQRPQDSCAQMTQY
jgi:lysophospholipase L1-like esterase